MSDITLDNPEWPEIIRAIQDQVQARIHTQCPGIVTAYDVATQTATVQLAVQLQGVSVPPLAEVPVVWPGGAASFLHVPLAVDDTVLVVFAESDFSKWLDSGSVSAPAVLTRHGFHAVAIPGLRRTALAVTGGHTTLAAAELRLGADAASAFVALANLVQTALDKMQYSFDNHTHATAATGTPSPPIPVPAVIPVPVVPVGSLGPVAAAQVKAI